MNDTQIRRPVKRGWLLLYLWLAAALPELVLHFAASGQATFFNSGLILGPVFALVPALVLFALCCLLGNRVLRFSLCLIYSAVLSLLYGSQLVYYRVFGTFYTFYSMTNGTGALQFTNTIFTAIGENLLVLGLMLLPLVFLAVFGLRFLRFDWPAWRKGGVIFLAVGIAVQLCAVASLPLFGGKGDTSPYGLYHTTSDAYSGVNKLGLLTAFRLDITRNLTGRSAQGSIVLESVPETTLPAPTEPPITEPAVDETTAPPVTEPPVTEPPVEYNVLDIDFDSLIERSSNESVTELHRYFASRSPTNKNEMTGIFEGSNLILITAEAFSHLLVTPERTPTLYKLMNEGISFSNYYVPDWGVSTTDGEYAFLTGTIPKDGVWSFAESSDNAMPLTMSRQLLDLGYSAYAYHGHTYTYYYRDEYLANLGYDYKGYGGGLDVTWQWPESDVEVVDLSTGDYTGSEPFTAYYMTISGHREFNFYGNCMAMKNKDLVENEPYSEEVRAYLACQLELEQALTLLLERLEEAGVLENTVIVLTADHYPNGLTPEQIGQLLGHTPESNFEIYQNGCFIYKPGMTPLVVEEPTSHLDLLPTLSNLFGLEFDSRLYVGRDVFSDSEPLVCFRNRSWITDKAMYNAATGEVTDLTGEPVTQGYIDSVNSQVNNRFTVSARILDHDYWSILFS